MKALRELSVFLFAAIILMTAVATATYFAKFGIPDAAQKMPALAMLIDGLSTTVKSWLAILIIGIIAIAALISDLNFTIPIFGFQLKSERLPLLLAPLAVLALVGAGESICESRYRRAISEVSALPILTSAVFDDDNACTDERRSCVRRNLPPACSGDAIAEECRVAHQTDQALYVVDISDPNLTPFAQRISMGKVRSVVIAVPDRPIS